MYIYSTLVLSNKSISSKFYREEKAGLLLDLYFSLTVRLASSALAFLLQLLRHVDEMSSVACASEPVLDLQMTCEQFQSYFESDITSFNTDTDSLNRIARLKDS